MGMVSTSLPIFSTFGVLIAQNCTSFFLKKFLAAVCCLDLKRRETDFSLKKTLFIARGFMDVYLRISYGKS